MCFCSGQMGNILSEWGQDSEFKGKPAGGVNLLQQVCKPIISQVILRRQFGQKTAYFT